MHKKKHGTGLWSGEFGLAVLLTKATSIFLLSRLSEWVGGCVWTRPPAECGSSRWNPGGNPSSPGFTVRPIALHDSFGCGLGWNSCHCWTDRCSHSQCLDLWKTMSTGCAIVIHGQKLEHNTSTHARGMDNSTPTYHILGNKSIIQTTSTNISSVHRIYQWWKVYTYYHNLSYRYIFH